MFFGSAKSFVNLKNYLTLCFDKCLLVNLERWRDEVCLRREKLVVLNDRLVLKGLSFYLWSATMFERIGDLFGDC